MRVLVTGGAGFVGGACVELLLRQGHTVVVVDRCNASPTPLAQKRATLAYCATLGPMLHLPLDIADTAAIDAAAGPIDAIVHLAALSDVAPSMALPADFATVNVVGTSRMLELAARWGVRRVVLASSSSVYGDARGALQHEGLAAITPESPYGASKRAAELFAAAWSAGTGIPVSALRFFTVYGPGQRPDMVVFRFMHAVAHGLPVRIRPGGSRDFVHVHDVARAIALALAAERPGFSVYNVATGVGTPLAALAERIAATIGRPLVVGPPPDPWPGDVGETWADTTRAATELGFRAAIALDEGLASAWAWQRA